MAAMPAVYNAEEVQTFVKGYVDQCIAGNIGVAQARIEEQLNQAGTFMAQCAKHADEAKERAELAGRVGEDAHGRIALQVDQVNKLKEFVENMMPSLQQMEANIKDLYQGVISTKAEVEQAKVDAAGQHSLLEDITSQAVEKVNADMLKWTTDFKRDVQVEITRLGAAGEGVSFGEARGKGRADRSGLDKKELSVWKLMEDVDKGSFRQWVEAIDIQLEMSHDFRYAGYVLAQIRRSKVPIDREVLDACCAAASNDVDK